MDVARHLPVLRSDAHGIRRGPNAHAAARRLHDQAGAVHARRERVRNSFGQFPVAKDAAQRHEIEFRAEHRSGGVRRVDQQRMARPLFRNGGGERAGSDSRQRPR